MLKLYTFTFCILYIILFSEYPSFVRLLEDVGARDGMVFADLGCGTGRALVAAALSEIKFLRCIGECVSLWRFYVFKCV